MARFDLNDVLGAVLGGQQKPARSRARGTRTASPLGGRGNQAALGRALGAVIGAAVEALSKSGPSAPPPPPPLPPRGKPVRGPDVPAATPRPAGPGPAPGPWWTGPARGADAPPPPGGSVPATAPGKPGPWAVPTAAPPPAAAPAPSAEHAEALLLVRAMIAAAKADGAVDAEERQGIARQLDAAGLTPAERDHVLADFDRPLGAEALAREARDPMFAAQLYAAAFAATRAVSAPERAWLDGFARALRLDRAAVEAIEKRLGGS